MTGKLLGRAVGYGYCTCFDCGRPRARRDRRRQRRKEKRQMDNELAYEMVQLAELGTAIVYESWPDWAPDGRAEPAAGLDPDDLTA